MAPNEVEERVTLNETASKHLLDNQERQGTTGVVHGRDSEQLKTEGNHKKQQRDSLLVGQDIDREDGEQYLTEETSEQLDNGEGQRFDVTIAGQSETEELSPTVTFNCKFFPSDSYF